MIKKQIQGTLDKKKETDRNAEPDHRRARSHASPITRQQEPSHSNKLSICKLERLMPPKKRGRPSTLDDSELSYVIAPSNKIPSDKSKGQKKSHERTHKFKGMELNSVLSLAYTFDGAEYKYTPQDFRHDRDQGWLLVPEHAKGRQTGSTKKTKEEALTQKSNTSTGTRTQTSRMEKNSEQTGESVTSTELVKKEETLQYREFEDLMKVAKCTVCLDVSCSHLNQCQQGHIICGFCLPRLTNKKCPACRLVGEFTRNRAVENLLDGYFNSKLWKCRYSERGCIHIFTSQADETTHCEGPQANCTFKDVKCGLCSAMMNPRCIVDHWVKCHYAITEGTVRTWDCLSSGPMGIEKTIDIRSGYEFYVVSKEPSAPIAMHTQFKPSRFSPKLITVKFIAPIGQFYMRAKFFYSQMHGGDSTAPVVSGMQTVAHIDHIGDSFTSARIPKAIKAFNTY